MEKWSLFDKNRIKSTIEVNRGEVIPEGLRHIVIHLAIFNSKGEMLIQHRQPFKSGWSNLWDLSVGGSAHLNEDSFMALKREAMEELGYLVLEEKVKHTLTLVAPNCYDDYYILKEDVDLDKLHLQYEEVKEVKWASLDEILKMIDNNEFIPYHKSFIEFLFLRQVYGHNTSRADYTKVEN